MTTDDATVTIAGLAARIDALTDALHDAHDNAGIFAANRDVISAALDEAIAERDALATQLAKVRTQLATASKVCALHGVALAGEVDAFHRLSTDRADAVSELDHIRRDLTACRTRIAELEADLFRSQRDEREIREALAKVAGRLKCGHSAKAVIEAVMQLETAQQATGAPCNGSCDIALARRQVGPDGAVPGNARECAELAAECDEAREAAAQLRVQLATARQVIDERTAERDQARADDQQTASAWLRLLKAIDPAAENTDDALRVVARLTAQLEAARVDLSLAKATNDQLKERCDAKVDVLTAHVAKLEAQPVLTADMVARVLPRAVASTKGWVITHPEETAKAIVEALGSVTLPAQDQAEELIAAYVDEFAARYEAEGNPPRMDRWHEVSAERRKFSIETMAATLAKVGAAATVRQPTRSRRA